VSQCLDSAKIDRKLRQLSVQACKIDFHLKVAKMNHIVLPSLVITPSGAQP
jgi:hypothetical protein